MSSPVPLLRPPVPGGRSQSGSRTPRLTLGIPPSPSQKPLSTETEPVPEIPRFSLAATAHKGPPKLSLATPMGSQGSLQDGGISLRPQIHPLNISAVTGNDAISRPRGDSFYAGSVPGSASSSTYSALSFAMHGRQTGTPDPSSAISSIYSEASIGGTSMERESSMGGLSIDFEKLAIEKGRPLDIDDLDDEGWGAASEQKKILELGSLGEGAGGAVTRCMLDGGKTIFALKVSFSNHDDATSSNFLISDHHYQPRSGRQETNPPRVEIQQELHLGIHLPILRRFYGQVVEYHFYSYGILRRRQLGQRLS